MNLQDILDIAQGIVKVVSLTNKVQLWTGLLHEHEEGRILVISAIVRLIIKCMLFHSYVLAIFYDFTRSKNAIKTECFT